MIPHPSKTALTGLLSLVVTSFSVQPVKAQSKPAAYHESVPAPTFSDIRYGDGPRNVLDFWQASSDEPTPLVVVIHGGGWNGGSKELLHKFVDTQQLLDAGISVAAINYRLMKHSRELEPPVRGPLYDAARAVQYLRSRADELNFDKSRVAAAGGSAGACTSLWLAYHDDLADPNSKDPVLRESTRLSCVAALRAQTSLDPVQMKTWIPKVTYGAHAFGLDSFETFLAERENILPWIEEYSPYALLTADDPATYLYYTIKPGTGKNKGDYTHSASFGTGLLERLQELEVPSELYYPESPNAVHQNATDYLISKLSKK
ncbi:alpha/beta hydrolase [Pelagicoccus sp. SDUM812005]|uniref:alpha/beta hydrolase n=1 Tax=Pelagicoccus sp. SDUM812005 TaxID=3041257 RepID=UPI00280DE79E|nr:alpha/beta hydrolase [Pelagicoccus sp. SDUM812005]MDQ8181558.1 alpha/beta hydrolase [Pelagicoccus sp. SDUM812005]